MGDITWTNERRKLSDPFWDWLAGFVAADGCFHSANDGKGHLQPRFVIHLRWDDVDILLEIQERLGFGNIYKKPSYRVGDKPAAQLQIAHVDSLAQLVQIFDAHPIRAKKQRDYEIWREMVHLCQQASDVRDKERLRFLHDKLRFVKRYETDETDEFERQGPEQLELGL